MAEYIKRETAVKAVMAAKWVDGSDGAMAMEIVASPPAADVAPVVHGRWISFLDGDHIMPERYYRCSRCGRVESRLQPYCHCGAKMDGERKDGGDG